MGSLVVPVIDVQNENFTELWPAMVLAIKTASFVALDTELSGLGNRKSLLAESIEDRYRAILHAARSRSILSLGIACYKRLDDKAADTYLVQVYNLTLLCSEEYVIEPQSVKFLVQHGFDFNKQYASGVPYLKGNNKGASDDRAVGIRGLFTELLRARKPMVFHNGLIDMAFLYQSFYSQLPDRLDNFTADLSEMFPAGVFDTKYVTEFELRLTASYLEYAYKKCKLDNSRLVTSGGTGPHVHVEFCQYAGHMSSYVDYRVCPAVTAAEGPTDICQRFSAFGWCPNGAVCPSSHDTDLIILQDEKGAGDKKKKRRKIREKKRGRGEAGNGPSIFDGAPEHKIPHMEADPGDTPAELRPKREPPMDGGGNPPPQSEGMDAKAGGEGKGASGDDPDRRNPVTAETAAAAAAAMAAAKAAAASATSAAASAARAASAATAAVTAATSAAASATSATVASAATATAAATAAATAPTDDTNESREEDGGRGALSDHPSEAGAPKTKADPGTHRAGFDAFMTGYIFAHACTLIKEDGVGAVEKEQQQQEEKKKKENKEEKAKSWLPTCFNKVYLSGKATPLNVVKSTFAKSSRAHLQKMEMLWGGAV